MRLLEPNVKEPVIGGVTFPRLPPEKIKADFVGSSCETAPEEAVRFYKLVKSASRAMGNKLGRNSTFLDFGCGRGRYLRIFWRDVRPESLHGVDVDPDMPKFCADPGVPGRPSRIDNLGTLPFPDRRITHLTAYLAFTHLPENVHLHRVAEIAQVMKPGASLILTTEPRRFLDFIETIPENASSVWHSGLRASAGDLDANRRAFDKGQFVCLSPGGGECRGAAFPSGTHVEAVVRDRGLHRRQQTFLAGRGGRPAAVRRRRSRPGCGGQKPANLPRAMSRSRHSRS